MLRALKFRESLYCRDAERPFLWESDTAIDAQVDLCLADGAYFLQVRLNVSLPGLDREVAQALVDAAEETCPYSKAIRGNVDVVINRV